MSYLFLFWTSVFTFHSKCSSIIVDMYTYSIDKVRAHKMLYPDKIIMS